MFIFFFFKQKTAYEMRISDWSSDVCSSDLLGASTSTGRCGGLSKAGCFSFHPRKLLTTGEGGMITTNDDVLVARLGVLRAHGGTRTEEGMEFIDFGFNYRMNEIQAALGPAQIDGSEDRRRVGKGTSGSIRLDIRER